MNRMNLLLSKIERRLGTKPLMLPEDINKDKTIFIQPYWKGPLKDIKMPEPIKAKLEIK
jgi:hypothetical protein